VANTSMVCV